MDETIMTIRYGMSSPVPGEMRIIPRAWLYGKGTVREFRRIIKLCVESDYFFGTDDLNLWGELLNVEIGRIKEAVRSASEEYNSHECDWTYMAEHKREYEKETREYKSVQNKFEKLLGVLQEMIK